MATIDFKSPATLRIVFCAVLASAALGLYFFTHFVPFGYPNRSDQMNQLKSEYEKKSTELARARASVADLPRFEAEYEQLHHRWSMAAELLPTDKQTAALLRKITLAGQQTGVQFVMFKPTAPKDETYYTEMPVEISVNGKYHQIGSFLAELANMRRIVTVAKIKLSSAPNNDHGHTAAAAFSASAYSLNSNPAPAATGKQAKPAAAKANAEKSGEGHNDES